MRETGRSLNYRVSSKQPRGGINENPGVRERTTCCRRCSLEPKESEKKNPEHHQRVGTRKPAISLVKKGQRGGALERKRPQVGEGGDFRSIGFSRNQEAKKGEKG